MDESVIFVKELRRGDSDVCVFDPKPTASKEKTAKKPLIDLGRESGTGSSGNIDKSPRNSPSVKKLEKSRKETGKAEKSLECPVCFEPMLNVTEVKVTHCGHVFCANCLNGIVSVPRPKCPICRRLLIKKQIRNIYFNC